MYNASKNIRTLLLIIFYCNYLSAQTVQTKLAAAYTAFEKDEQLQNALSSLYVIDAATGKVVFGKNSSIGMAPASTQKIIVSASAYEALGKNFVYTTTFSYTGTINDSNAGDLYIRPSGDPTLGSWRWKRTAQDSVLSRIAAAIRSKGLTSFNSIIVNASGWEGETVPDGWVWDDIGNYYGAGAGAINWHENQYDLILNAGKKIGEQVIIKGTNPQLFNHTLTSYVTTAEKGTGDRTIIYLPVGSAQGTVRGTIPLDENNFTVSGAMPAPGFQFTSTLSGYLSRTGIPIKQGSITKDNTTANQPIDPTALQLLHSEVSPDLDSIIYWYLKKSINLYGEALIKSIAYQKTGTAATRTGIDWIKSLWKDKGVAATELNIIDGSGLSPLNRVTTHAQVSVLAYAQKQPWFSAYYNAFPEYNGMKMKSGTISGVKGFCGYQKAADGKEYIFSFLVNNYNGTATALIRKMYRVLDIIK